uniref:SBP-type domain-containing protein n=1 Tax=Tetradesmus obliquus TaxID=3088 RepID=A0A383VWZ1_TETOB
MEAYAEYTAADVQGTDANTEAEHDAGTTQPHPKAGICQVKGCAVDLAKLNKAYYLRKRACPRHLKVSGPCAPTAAAAAAAAASSSSSSSKQQQQQQAAAAASGSALHSQAPEVLLEGCDEPMRFCHQCGKFESVAAFEGLKRSCAVRLLRRRTHQQNNPRAADQSHFAHTTHQPEQQQQQQQQRRSSKHSCSSDDEDYVCCKRAAAETRSALARSSSKVAEAGKAAACKRGMRRFSEDDLDPDFKVQFRKPKKSQSATPAEPQPSAAAMDADGLPTCAANQQQQQQQQQQLLEQLPEDAFEADTFMILLLEGGESDGTAASTAVAADLEAALLAELTTEMQKEQQQLQQQLCNGNNMFASSAAAGAAPLQLPQQLAAVRCDGCSSSGCGGYSSSGSNCGYCCSSKRARQQQEQQAAQLADAILAEQLPAPTLPPAAGLQQQQQQQHVRCDVGVQGAAAAAAPFDKTQLIEQLVSSMFEEMKDTDEPMLLATTPSLPPPPPASAAAPQPQPQLVCNTGSVSAYTHIKQQQQQQQQCSSLLAAQQACSAAALSNASPAYCRGFANAYRAAAAVNAAPCYNMDSTAAAVGFAAAPMQLAVPAAAAAGGFVGVPMQLAVPAANAGRSLAVHRMALLQQQMLAMTSQLQQLQSIVAGIGPAAPASAMQGVDLMQQQLMLQQQQQQVQMQVGNALLLPQLSNVSTLSSTLQHHAWML